jgi:predicted nucleotidyltransferase
MYVFGSALKKSFQPDSDIDLLVAFEEFDLAEYLDNYLDLKLSLENLFKRKVDLVEVQTLKNPVLIRSIDRNKEQIYG